MTESLYPRHGNSGPAPEVTPPTLRNETVDLVNAALKRSEPLVRDAVKLGRSLSEHWANRYTSPWWPR